MYQSVVIDHEENLMNNTKVSELTVDELVSLIEATLRRVMREQNHSASVAHKDQRAILDIPPLSVGEWPEGLQLISREEYYEDDAR